MITLLQKKIEILRAQMIQLANEKGSFIDKDVVAISQDLDRFLVKVQRVKMMKARREAATYLGDDDTGFAEISAHLPSGTLRPSLKSRKHVLKTNSFVFTTSCSLLYKMQK